MRAGIFFSLLCPETSPSNYLALLWAFIYYAEIMLRHITYISSVLFLLAVRLSIIKQSMSVDAFFA